MTSNSVTVLGVLLCLSVMRCTRWLVKRQDDCLTRPDACIHNGITIVNLFFGGGFDSLVVNGRFSLKCGQQDRQDTDRCIEDNLDCTSRYDAMGLKDAMEFMCNNEEAFINGSPCWTSGTVSNTMDQCVLQSEGDSYCSLPSCLQDEIAKIPDCTAQDASLFYEIAQFGLSRITC